jgi:PPK2 family polyphosphate:nucleotide phosphotransferase
VTPFASPYLVPTDGSCELSAFPTAPAERQDKEALEKRLKKTIKRVADLQEALYADDRYALLLVFQAMDAAGKDSTVRAVTTGINPAGFQVFSFKQPSREELDHDFLWRTNRCTPERGRIGVFNRSYYEEVLVVRVHPEYLDGQRLPREVGLEQLWEKRYESIRDLEKHLAHNGTVVVKFFLNVSRAEQHKRFAARIDEPEKNWKFSAGDLDESERWDDYQSAYQHALRATSRPWAPWYAIPADHKPYMRAAVADIILGTLEALPLRFPQPTDDERERMQRLRALLITKDESGRP